MPKSGVIDDIRNWLDEGAAAPVIIGVAVLAFAVVALFFIPLKRPDVVVGMVERFGNVEGEAGGSQVVTVRLGDHDIVVMGMPPVSPCVVGGPIRLVRSTHLWGVAYRPAAPLCPRR